MNVTRAILASSVVALLAATPTFAAVLTWDTIPGTVGAGDGIITGGGGTWDTTSGLWTPDGGLNDQAWVNANNDQAVFGDVAGTVTLGAAISANALTFNTSGYVITGNTLTLGGTTPTITVASGQSDTVASLLAGTAGLVVAGGGTLSLSAYNTFTGNTTVNAGSTLNLSNAGATGVGTVRGVLTIGSGATVGLNSVDALGYTTNVCVSTVNVNGGTINNTTTGNNGFITNFVLTGGTASSTGGGAYNFNTGFGVTTNASTITSLISAPIVIRGGSLTFTTAAGSTPSGTDLSVTGIISGGANSITKAGNGVMAIGVNTTYTGGTTVNGGVLDLTAGGGGTGVIRGTATVNSGATLRLSTGDALGFTAGAATSVNTLNINSGTVNVNTTANQTFSTMNLTMNAGTISGIAGSNIDLFNTGTAINTTAAATSSVISIPTMGLRQNDTAFNIADGAAPVDLLVSGNLINNSGANNQGNHNLVKNGNGVMQLTGANSYTGTTKVNAGTFALGGAGTLASPSITIVAGALFDVSSLTAGSFGLASGQTLIAGRTSAFANDVIGNLNSGAGIINIAGTSTAGTLTLGGAGAGNLTLGGGTVSFDLANVATAGAGVNDLLKVNNLTLSGTTSIAINKLNGALTSATYTLINYTGALVGGAANLTLSGAAGGTTRQNFTLDTTTTPGAVLLTVSGNSATLLWAGDGAANVWDVATTSNFKNGAAADKYFDGDLVTFDDTGSNTPDIALTGTISPGTLTVNNTTKNYTFGGTGTLAGGTGLTKNGNGILTLSSATHSFTGPVVVNAGTVSTSAIANSGTASGLGAGTAITLGDATHSGKLQLTGVGLTMTTNRALTVNAGGGTLELTDAGTTLTESGSWVLSGPFTKSGNGTLAIAAAVSGTGSFTQSAGTVNVSVMNSFSGDLNITGGTFNTTIGLANGVTTPLGAGNGTRNITIGPGATMNWGVNNTLVGGGGTATSLPTITINGGTLTTTRYNAIGNVVLNSGATLVQSATDAGGYEGYQFIGTVTAGGTSASTISSPVGKANHLKGAATTIFNVGDATGDANPDLTISNTIRDGSGDYPGVGALQKTGTGTLLLTASETYTGATTVTNGTLALSNSGRLASAAINVGATGTLDLSALGGYTFNTAQTITISGGGLMIGPSTVPTGSTLIAGRTSAFGTDISGDFTSLGTLNVAGTGTAGTLKVAASGGALGTPGTLLIGGGSVNFDLAGTSTAGAGVNDLITTAGDLFLFNLTNIVINPLTGGLNTGNYTLITYGGTLFGDTSNLALVGVTNSARQTFALDTTTTAGAVLLDVTGIPGNLIWVGNGTTNPWDHTTANVFSGPADNHFFDGDNVTFNDTGSNTPAVQLSGSLIPSAVTFNNTTKDYTLAGTGSIDGTTGLTKNGNGTVTINNTNSFTGTVAINAGTISVPTIAAGGVNSPLGAGTNITLGDATHQGTLLLSGTGLTATTNRVLTLNAGGGAVNVSDPGTNLTLTGIIGGTGALTKLGNGTLTLSAAEAFTGGTTVNAGTLTLTIGGIIGTLGGTVTINSGGTLISQVTDSLGYGASRATTININGGTFTHTPAINISIWGMTVNMTGGLFQATDPNGRIDFGTDNNATNIASVVNTFASANTATIGGTHVNLRQTNTTFTVADGAAATDLLISAPISEGLVGSGITKAGPGTMVLSGAGSTYTGPTLVSGGKLLVNGSISASAVTVTSGGILGGSGATGAVSAASGGVVSPGDGPGLLATAGLAMVSGSTLSMDLNTNTVATGYDQVNVTGSVDVTGATLSLSGTYVAGTGVHDLFFLVVNDGLDPIGGTFNGLGEGGLVQSTSGQNFLITYAANAEGTSFTGGNDIGLMAVPEPSVAVALLGGVGLLCVRRRRR